MEQSLKNLITKNCNILLEAHSCCKEAKDAARAWLNAVGTDKEADATEALVCELQQDIVTIDDLIDFMGSAKAKEIFGEEGAQKALENAKISKETGALYCTCPACAACEAILTALGKL